MRRRHVEIGTGTAYTAFADASDIHSIGGLNSPCTARVCEYILVNREVTEAERRAVTDYLVAKWAPVAASNTSVDNAVATFDGTTGAVVQSSPVAIDDAGNLTSVASVNAVTFNETAQMTTIRTASFIDYMVFWTTTTTTLDWNNSASQYFMPGGNVTLTFIAPPEGSRVMLRVIQDKGGSTTITWPSTVRWLGGSAPTLSTTAGDVDIITFYFVGGTYWGSAAGAAAWDLVQELADKYNAHLFWSHDEPSGTQADDIGPNADHGTYTSMTVAQSGVFPADLNSVSGTSAYTRVTALTDSLTDVLTVLSLHSLTSKNSVYDINGTGGRQLWYNVTGNMTFFDTTNRNSGRAQSAVQSAGMLQGFTRTSTTNIDLYENGLKWRALTTAAVTGITTPTVAHGARYTAGPDASTGNYGFLAVLGARLTEAEHYDVWKKLTGTRHFWHEFVVPNGLDADCVQYLVLWEQAGTQLLDVSGNLAHGTDTSALTHGVDPLDSYHLQCVESAGIAYITTGLTVINVSTTTAWTIAGVCSPAASLDGVFLFGGTSNCIGLCNVSGNLRLFTHDGTNLTVDVTQPSGDFGWCVRRNGDLVDWWLDGVKKTGIDMAGPSFSSSTVHYLMTWAGTHSVSAWDGKFQHRGTYTAAFSDAICANLATILLPPGA